MELQGKRVLVVGANGVLGDTIAQQLLQGGAQVLGTARSAESAGALAANLSERLLLDLADVQSVRTMVDYLVASGLPLDGVVIASGRVGFGTAEHTDPGQAATLLQINHAGPAHLIASLLPALRVSAAAGREPFVAGITGVVSERAFPGMAAYVASKTAHAAWLAALRLELRRERIRVIDAHPGHTETGLATRPLFGAAPAFPVGHAPEHVASVIVAAIGDGATTDVPSSAF